MWCGEVRSTHSEVVGLMLKLAVLRTEVQEFCACTSVSREEMVRLY